MLYFNERRTDGGAIVWGFISTVAQTGSCDFAAEREHWKKLSWGSQGTGRPQLSSYLVHPQQCVRAVALLIAVLQFKVYDGFKLRVQWYTEVTLLNKSLFWGHGSVPGSNKISHMFMARFLFNWHLCKLQFVLSGVDVAPPELVGTVSGASSNK